MNRKGFTLIELLLVALLLPIVSFAVFSNFSSGFRLWRAVNQEVVEEDLSIFYEQMAGDVENMRRYSSLPFEGDAQKTSFCTRIPGPPELGGDRGIGRVTYAYDHDKKALFRETRDLNEVYKEKPGITTRPLENVSDFHISYYYKNVQDDRYEWADAWQGAADALPLAVRFEFTFERGGKKYSFTRSMAVPLGQGQ